MMHAIEQFMVSYGLIVVYFGVILEGDSVLIAAGFLAHQGVLDPVGVFLAAFAGSLSSDQALSYAGRYFAGSPMIRRQTEKPLFARVLDMIRRHRVPFVLAFRFIYGIRTISPIAIGVAGVPAALYTVLNVASALVWAALLTVIGYAFGSVIERYAGRLHGFEHKLLIALVIVVALLPVLHFAHARWLRAPANPASGGPADRV
jgi:membrane protein DedA with SNARE-associated domain